MVESSLANWDGSLTPVKTASAPIPAPVSATQSTSSQNANLVNSGTITALPGPKESGSTESVTSAHLQALLDANAPLEHSAPVSPMSISPSGTIVPLALQQPQSPFPSHFVRIDFPPPPPPLHFGTPCEILTTPVSSQVVGPSWLKHTSPRDGLIPLDIPSPTRPKAGRTVQRAHTITHSPTHTPASSALSSARSSPSVLGGKAPPAEAMGTLWLTSALPRSPPVSTSALVPSSGGFGSPSTLLGGPIPSFGALGPALRSSALSSALGVTSTLGIGVSASTSTPPSARVLGSWWNNGRTHGGDQVPQTKSTPTASSSKASRSSKSAGGMGDAGKAGTKTTTDKAKTKDDSRHAGDAHKGAAADRHRRDDSLRPEKEGRARSVVTYESKAKKARSREESEARSTLTSMSTYKRGPSGIASAGGSKSKGPDQLFMSSPEISRVPTPHELFTPPPELLFTPTPTPERLFTPPERLFTPYQARSVSPPQQRARVRPGVGVAYKVDETKPQKRKREFMDYVCVPPLPYKRARTELGQRRKESTVAGRSVSRSVHSVRETYNGRQRGEEGARGRERWSASSEREWEVSRSRSRSRSRTTQPPKIRAAPAVQVQISSEVADALNQAWATNDSAGTLPVGGAVGREVIRAKRKYERKPERDREKEGPRKRVQKALSEERGRKRLKTLPPPEQRPQADNNGAKMQGAPAPARAKKLQDVAVVDAVQAKGKAKEARVGAWCRDEGDVTQLLFNVAVEDADQMASAALQFQLRGEGGLALRMTLGSLPTPCLVWPPRASGAEEEVSAGGPILGIGASEGSGRRRVRDDVSKGKQGLDEVPRGRSVQRKTQSLQNQTPLPQHEQQEQIPSVRHDMQDTPRGAIIKPKPALKKRALPGPSQEHGHPPSPMSSLALSQSALYPPPSFPSSPAFVPAPPTIATATLEAPPSASTSPINPLRMAPAPMPVIPIPPQSVGAELVEELSMPLSMKAKGKQRALDKSKSRTPSPVRDGLSSPWIPRSASRGRRSASRGLRSASRGHRSASRGHAHALRSPADNGMSSYFRELDAWPPGFRISPQGLLHHYPAPPTLPDIATALGASSDETQLPLGNNNPGLHLILDNEPYGDGTIDPSLLGGGMMEVESYDAPDHEHIQIGMDSPTSSVASSSLSPEPCSSPIAVRSSGRRPVHRHIPSDMVPTDLLDSDGHFSSSASSSGYSSDNKPPSPKPKAKPKQASKRRKVVDGETKVNASAPPSVPSADRFFRYSGPPWPPGPDAFCHQCRHKTQALSTKYDDCAHSFCVRCIMTKYDVGTVPFELNGSSDDCPKCSDICTCDVCSTRRGETYAFARCKVTDEVEPAAPRTPRTTRAPRVHQPRDPSLDRMVIEPTTYYATMYDHSGARVADTFIGADGDDEVVVACPVKPPHLFIGAVQEGWKLGPNPHVYVEPTPALSRKPRKEGPKRYYIGKQSVLSLHVRPRPATPAPVPIPVPIPAVIPCPAPPPNIVTDLDDNFPLSPLSSLSDTEPPDEDDGPGESQYSFSLDAADGVLAQKPPRTNGGCADFGDGGGIELTESDVARAISSALMASGIPTIMAFEPPFVTL
ncbi:hypothetical protein DFH09DRAFT_1183490 [Mycena vulgaris]|nr:hypothetical protein DFH09DRAFT_1183490 [Mycena vulgaris]